jgi:hypothetical protein
MLSVLSKKHPLGRAVQSVPHPLWMSERLLLRLRLHNITQFVVQSESTASNDDDSVRGGAGRLRPPAPARSFRGQHRRRRRRPAVEPARPPQARSAPATTSSPLSVVQPNILTRRRRRRPAGLPVTAAAAPWAWNVPVLLPTPANNPGGGAAIFPGRVRYRTRWADVLRPIFDRFSEQDTDTRGRLLHRPRRVLERRVGGGG